MIVGTVTKATGAVIAPAQQTQGNTAAYSARNAGGINLGFFPSASVAQQAVSTLSNNNKPLHWEREDLAGDIEHWVGRNDKLDPGEIWGEALFVWAEMDAGVALNSTTGDVRRVGNRAIGTGTFASDNFLQNTAADQPALINPSFGSRPALSFTAGSGERMVSENFVLNLTEFSVFVVLSREAAAAARTAVEILGISFDINTAAGGEFELDNGGALITAPLVAVGQQTLLSAEQRDTGAQLFQDGTSVGSNATASSGTTTDARMSDTGASTWSGRIAALVIAEGVSASQRIATERYLRERYNTP